MKQTRSWYRNAGRTRYHAARPDWVRSGRALCGADIKRPGFVSDNGPPAHPGTSLGACAHCRKQTNA